LPVAAMASVQDAVVGPGFGKEAGRLLPDRGRGWRGREAFRWAAATAAAASCFECRRDLAEFFGAKDLWRQGGRLNRMRKPKPAFWRAARLPTQGLLGVRRVDC